MKVAELALMGVAASASCWTACAVLLLVLVGLGVQASFSGR